jgi:flagellin-like protein
MADKKGVSPLIATVLLIAFAVSLGAVLLTYMTTLGECGGVSIEIATIDNEPQVCFNTNNNKVSFSIENSGRQDIEYFKVTMTGALNVENTDQFTTIRRAEVGKVELQYAKTHLGVLQKLKITPVVDEGGEEAICGNDQSIIIEGIPEC